MCGLIVCHLSHTIVNREANSTGCVAQLKMQLSVSRNGKMIQNDGRDCYLSSQMYKNASIITKNCGRDVERCPGLIQPGLEMHGRRRQARSRSLVRLPPLVPVQTYPFCAISMG